MYYKVLDKNNQAIYQGFDYTPYLDGTWTPRVKDTIICKRGYHGTTDPMQHPYIGMKVYFIKGKGAGDAQDDKRVFESISIQEERPEMVPQWWHNVEDFIEGLKDVPWGVPQCEPKDNWVMLNSGENAGDDEAWNSHFEVWDSHFVVAWRASWIMARGAAEVTTWRAAGNGLVAARKAARKAARIAAGKAWTEIESVALRAGLLVCDGLYIPQEHVDFIEGLWDVCRNGYFCCGYKDGKYLVYKIGE